MLRTILLLAFLVSPASATFTLISKGSAHAANTSTASLTAQDTTGAKLFVMVGLGFSASSCIDGVGGGTAATDNLGNTWSRGTNFTNGNANVCVFWVINPTTNVSTTFNLLAGAGGTYPQLFAYWYSATGTVTKDTGPIGANTATGTTLQPGSVTPSINGALIVTGIADGAVASTRTIDSGFSTVDQNSNNSFATGGASYLIQTTAAAVNPTWTEGVSALTRAATIIAFIDTPSTGTIRHRVVGGE